MVVQNNGSGKLLVTADLDAESMSDYYFSIYAVDNGTRARKSERSKVHCKIVDVNEFAPIFRHPTYSTDIERGRAYENILQVRQFK